MIQINIQITNLIPALIFFILNVFIPGPNVLNTIATSMGSGRKSGIFCAMATGLGVVATSLFALSGVAIIFYKVPIIYTGLTFIGGLFLIYFSKRYIQKAFSSSAKLIAIKGVDNNRAFRQAFLVLISNPKMMTTYLAIVSLFPIVAGNFQNALVFSLLAGISSFTGHLIFATVFSTSIASKIYMNLYKPINALVGIGFIFYALKLFSNLI
jgi:threonine/homoserine/homoserine lactone efflux protein